MNLKSVFKGVVSSTLAVGLITGVGTLPTFAQSTESSPENYVNGSRVITPFDMNVSDGSYSGTGFSTSYKLTSSNGKNVNFWVQNTGKVSVKITINGDHEKTLKKGESGHISASVGYFASEYKFKAVATPNGGDISIDYKIAQRD
ncbi:MULTISPECIES: hypothetical protein [Paenibacillus]|uniref:Uncharacterized protein n=1 Tax=Paenibacillus polymyxa TaxID=1406 RepID=A0A378XZ65_PAEPO|nr:MULTISPECIES: hypothetical protein [Paenibacillus]AZH29196.1 hypothetical protein EGM68_10690 [Paenibacillus sp. M-152]MBE7898077.1 hypothetical protein [Paenibacillus polymyxa]MBG9763259.1 hypothetical protein [Paenibacillus polymyxa]MCC3257904.1 hypothetical protein [Paenibacillus polymyxa]MCJ1219762.1 hypothetical protein [Paenibacillus polymyxa]